MWPANAARLAALEKDNEASAENSYSALALFFFGVEQRWGRYDAQRGKLQANMGKASSSQQPVEFIQALKGRLMIEIADLFVEHPPYGYGLFLWSHNRARAE